jgi:hypothetical protein
MSRQNNAISMLDDIARVLITCFGIGILFLAIWTVLVMGLPDRAWQIHAKLFDLSREQVALVHYAGLVITKAGVFALFLLPYLGIRLALRKRNNLVTFAERSEPTGQ